MMTNSRKRNVIDLILNILMVVLVVYAVGWFFTGQGLKSGVGNMDGGGLKCLRFFTIESNIFAAVSSAVMIVLNVKALRTGEGNIPVWAVVFKFVGTTAVTLTFLVVILFLGPITGYDVAFENSCLELHLICPLLAIVSFCCFEQGYNISGKQILWGVLPTVLYGIMYFINVIITENWPDFYYFNRGGHWYISCIALPLVTYLIAYVISAVHNKMGRN